MPTYRIRCGDMDTKIKTPHEADCTALALMAVDQALPQKPGALVEVSGGQYTGAGAIYLAFESIARKLGRLG